MRAVNVMNRKTIEGLLFKCELSHGLLATIQQPSPAAPAPVSVSPLVSSIPLLPPPQPAPPRATGFYSMSGLVPSPSQPPISFQQHQPHTNHHSSSQQPQQQQQQQQLPFMHSKSSSWHF